MLPAFLRSRDQRRRDEFREFLAVERPGCTFTDDELDAAIAAAMYVPPEQRRLPRCQECGRAFLPGRSTCIACDRPKSAPPEAQQHKAAFAMVASGYAGSAGFAMHETKSLALQAVEHHNAAFKEAVRHLGDRLATAVSRFREPPRMKTVKRVNRNDDGFITSIVETIEPVEA